MPHEKSTRGRGRPKGTPHNDRARERIRTSMLINRLEKIAEGKVEAEPHQVTAALGLLKKTLPDLSAQDITSGGQALVIERVQFKKPT